MLHAPLAKVPVAFFFLRNPMSALPPLELKNAHACFGGAQRFYEHFSAEIGLNMKFSVFLPPKAVAGEKVPAVLYLAGLTCTEETFMTKAGAQRLAAELGIALIAPDTSPRGAGLPGEADAWDFGVRSEEHTSELQSPCNLVCRLLLENK